MNTQTTCTRFTYLPFSFSRFTHLTLFLFNFNVLLAIFPLTSALQITSISSNDPSIDYQPHEGVWNSIGDSSATNGSFKLARTWDGVATLRRNFRSMYFASPLWPFPIHVQISVDDMTHIIDLQDHSVSASKTPPTGLDSATNPSDIRWSFHDVDKERTVKLSAGDSSESGWIAIVDNLIFEVAEPGDPPVAKNPSPLPTPLSGSSVTGSDNAGTGGTNLNLNTLTQPTSTGTGPSTQTSSVFIVTSVDGPSPSPSSWSNSSGDHEAEKKNKKQKIMIMAASICASALLSLLGGAIMWGLKRQRDRRREMKRMNDDSWRYGGGLVGGIDEKRHMAGEKHPVDLDKGEMTNMARNDSEDTLDLRLFEFKHSRRISCLQERPHDSCIHPHYAPNSSDDASFSTFSATSRDSMDEAMSAFGASYGMGHGVHHHGRERSTTNVVHGSTSSLASADPSSYLLESSCTSHRTETVIRQVERVYLEARDLRLVFSRESLRASVGPPIAEVTISAASRNTSSNVTPSTEFGSTQWHEVVHGFPTPPGSARVVCHEESMVAMGGYSVNGCGPGKLNVDGRRDSCWSASFPFPVPRIPLPGLPCIPGSASSTQVLFDVVRCDIGSSPLAHDAAVASIIPQYHTHSRTSPCVSVDQPVHPPLALTIDNISASKLQFQPSRYDIAPKLNTTTHVSQFEAFIPPCMSYTPCGINGIPTPPPSGRGSKFAFGLGVPGVERDRDVIRAPYDSQSPYASSLDTLGKLEAELDG